MRACVHTGVCEGGGRHRLWSNRSQKTTRKRRLWSGRTWSNMSRYLMANISLPLRVLRDDIHRQTDRSCEFLRSCRVANFFFSFSIIR